MRKGARLLRENAAAVDALAERLSQQAGGAATLGLALPRTELHFHLLPGVEDGPPGLPDALALARQTVDDGTGW